jgi:hypothetical protein
MFLRSRRSDNNRNRTRRQLSLESLEGRQLLSLGSEFLVNTTTRNFQFHPAVASSSNGMSVVVWTDTFSSTDHDIRAQLYNRFQQKQGPEIVVAGSSRDDDQPAVAMDPNGNFVVAWRQSAPGNDTNVVAQRFNSSGVPVGGNVQVGAGTFTEHDPSVAMDAFGRFTVAYVRDTNYGFFNPDVFAKRYDANNNLLNVFDVGISSKAETHPSIAMAPDGRFDVAYQLQFSTTDDDILMARYAANGALLGTSSVAISTAREQLPSVSMDDSGNAVVAYQKLVGNDFDIKARRVSSAGSVGGEINIQSTLANEGNASVALKRGGGGFVVSYDSGSNVKVTEVSATDAVLATYDAGSQRFGSAVSIDGFDRYTLAYTSTETQGFPFPSIDLNIRGRFGRLS